MPTKHPLSPPTLPLRSLNRKGALAPQEGHFTSLGSFPFLFLGNSTLAPHSVQILLGTLFPPYIITPY